jgi:phage-related minor tail protein
MNEKVIKVAKNTIKSVAQIGTGFVIGGIVVLTVGASKNPVVSVLKIVAGTVAGAVVSTYMTNKVINPTVDEMFESFENAAEHEKSGKTVINCVIL